MVKKNINYNEFVGSLADYEENEKPQEPKLSNGLSHGKRVPYIGWYWRDTDFSGKCIPIGDCDEFIGIMENNKWGYPERLLTEEEADKVIEIIESAMRENKREDKIKSIEKLWGYFQTLEI